MSIGYMGWAKLVDARVLPTGGGFGAAPEPIYSSAALGLGWRNAGVGKYALNVVKYEGSLDIDIDDGGSWTTIASWCYMQRVSPIAVTISPDNATVFTYTSVYNTSLSVSTGQGNLVSASLGGLSFSRAETAGVSYLANINGIGCPSGNPIPYWATTATLGGSTGSTIEWSVDVTQNTLPIYACAGSRTPYAVLQGQMDASASITLYSESGASGGGIDTESTFGVSITGVGGLSLPRTLIESDSYDISDPNSAVYRTISVKGLAKCDAGNEAPCTIT